MSQTILYIAMSLDGYIADSNGGVDWLRGDGSEPGNEGTYATFLTSVKYVIMGSTTYRQIKTALSPGHWPYPGKACYVLTHRELPDDQEVRFRSDPQILLDELQKNDDGDVWICGGSSVVSEFLKARRIDVLRLALIPTTLGQGIVLFEAGFPMQEWSLWKSVTYDGIVELTYHRRESR